MTIMIRNRHIWFQCQWTNYESRDIFISMTIYFLFSYVLPLRKEKELSKDLTYMCIDFHPWLLSFFPFLFLWFVVHIISFIYKYLVYNLHLISLYSWEYIADKQTWFFFIVKNYTNDRCFVINRIYIYIYRNNYVEKIFIMDVESTFSIDRYGVDNDEIDISERW